MKPDLYLSLLDTYGEATPIVIRARRELRQHGAMRLDTATQLMQYHLNPKDVQADLLERLNGK